MKEVRGRDRISENLPDLLCDESRAAFGIPDYVFYPENKDDVLVAIATAIEKDKSIIGIGALTGITGSGVPCDDCVAICFDKMTSILRVEKKGNNDLILYCQPGITLQEIGNFLNNPQNLDNSIFGFEFLSDGSWFYPPDPTEMTAQLGGTVATNASGARSYCFGSTRKHIDTLSMVFSNGDTLTVHRGDCFFQNDQCTITTGQGSKISIPLSSYVSPINKNAAGYYSQPSMDLIDLFIGSEGTLSLYTEIGIRLTPTPNFIGGLSFFSEYSGAFDFADFLRKNPAIAAIEYFDSSALSLIKNHKDSIGLHLPEFPKNSVSAIYWEYIENNDSIFENEMEEWDVFLQNHHSSFDSTWSGFENDEMNRLKSFRHAVPELINMKISEYKKDYPAIRKISTDAAVSSEYFNEILSGIKSLIDNHNLDSVIFGHLGDYHLHVNIIPRNSEEMEKAIELYSVFMDLYIDKKGTVSAEHGIGKIKTVYLEKMVGIKTIKDMKNIKTALDPNLRLNPGNLFVFD